jgi:long-chain fatty acid transport protein
VTPRLAIIGQVDWINWSDAFDTLEVRLRHVDNALYRELTGGKSNLDDDVPLRWRDQWVFRVGAEWTLDEHWTLRAGYRYGRSPVPAETLTPMNAAISEYVVSAGLGAKWGRTSVDFAWQWDLPQSESVGRTDLLSGEYNHSDVKVGVHWLTLTTAYEF